LLSLNEATTRQPNIGNLKDDSLSSIDYSHACLPAMQGMNIKFYFSD